MLEAIKSYIQLVSERRKSYRAGRRNTVYTIEHTSDEMKLSWLTMENQQGEFVFKWRDAVRLEAFKRDQYAVDLICVVVVLVDKREVEINEDMTGWDSLMRNLPEYLSGCKEFDEWYDVVAKPPFKENLTVIYERSAT